MKNIESYVIRDYVKKDDIEIIEKITRETNFFSEDEVSIARELAEERFTKDIKSGYLYNILEKNNEMLGYTCFGPIPCSNISYDLYWIVIKNELRGQGIGSYLLNKTEDYIKKLNGYQVYLDTSSKEQYLPTRNFYLKSGYKIVSILENFYDIKDNKIIFNKIL